MTKKISTKGGDWMVIPESTQEHLQAHPEVAELLEGALKKITLPKGVPIYLGEIDMGRELGESGAVHTAPVKPDEETTFAFRIGREGPTRVVHQGTQSEIASTVVIVAKPTEDFQEWELLTAYVGKLTPREPWDPGLQTDEEKSEALNFWSQYALVHDPEVMGEIFVSTWEEVLKICGAKFSVPQK